MSSGISFTCDSCGREVFSCNIVNGMKFCAKCYQETFGETDKDRKISDLEAKLAESEKERHEEWKTGKEWKWEWQKVNQKLEKADQDKISFAIEQLEKVKENIKKVPITDFDLSGNFEKMYKQDAIRQIDNQIKSLKGEE